MRQSSSHRAASVLAAVLAEQGVRHAVVSPGSRNAPLVLALHLQPDIDVHVSIDERAAAHHALGMALATWTPVPVVCTSGTAALNHGPALAEAFHARVPLLSVTADRPQGVAGRGHGQTIHQTDIHRAHTVHRDVLDASVMNDEALVAAARQAIRASLHGGPGGSAGPVHLNVPFEEPLYELGATPPLSASDVAPMPPTASPPIDPVLEEALERGTVLVVAGPRPSALRQPEASRLVVAMPCLAERGSNVLGPLVIHGGERLLQDGHWPDGLKPEAILTLGLPPMNKGIRQALEGLPHWHLDGEEGSGWDIWETCKGLAPADVLQRAPRQAEAWAAAKRRINEVHDAFDAAWSDLKAWTCMAALWRTWPEDLRPAALHLANSASARYAQWVDLHPAMADDGVVHANRGVAGIDGCTSTAVGWQACIPGRDTWIVTGDVAFHYDANAFLTNPVPQGLKVVVMNNGGGGIFRWLPGTKHEGMFERHFETPPNRTVRSLAQAMDALFLQATDAETLDHALTEARNHEGNVVLEVVTPAAASAHERERYHQAFRKPFAPQP